MRISHFFIDRPIFASVVSIVFVILGAVAFVRLPVAQYPEIAPPTITVSGQYPGASADVVASTVVDADRGADQRRREHDLRVVELDRGRTNSPISVTFDIGTNLDIAQVQVQNRVAIAQPRLPADVRNIGVVVAKASPDLMMVVHLYSPDKSRDTLFISNYATLEISDAVTRVDGVGSIIVFGARDYAMRIWLDPDRLQSVGLTANDVVTRAARAERAGRVWHPRPAADGKAARVPDRGADARPAGRSGRVRQYRRQADRDRHRARQGCRAGRAGGAGLFSRIPISISIPQSRSAVFQRPGSNALATAQARSAPPWRTSPSGFRQA